MTADLYEIEVGPDVRARGTLEWIMNNYARLVGQCTIYLIKQSKINAAYNADEPAPCPAGDDGGADDGTACIGCA